MPPPELLAPNEPDAEELAPGNGVINASPLVVMNNQSQIGDRHQGPIFQYAVHQVGAEHQAIDHLECPSVYNWPASPGCRFHAD